MFNGIQLNFFNPRYAKEIQNVNTKLYLNILNTKISFTPKEMNCK